MPTNSGSFGVTQNNQDPSGPAQVPIPNPNPVDTEDLGMNKLAGASLAGASLAGGRGGSSSGSSSNGSDNTGAMLGKAAGAIGGSIVGGPVGGAIGGFLGDIFGGLFAAGGPVDNGPDKAALTAAYLTGALHQEKYGGTPNTLGQAANDIKGILGGRRNEILMGMPYDFDEYDNRDRMEMRGLSQGTQDTLIDHKHQYASGGSVQPQNADADLAQQALLEALGLAQSPAKQQLQQESQADVRNAMPSTMPTSNSMQSTMQANGRPGYAQGGYGYDNGGTGVNPADPAQYRAQLNTAQLPVNMPQVANIPPQASGYVQRLPEQPIAQPQPQGPMGTPAAANANANASFLRNAAAPTQPQLPSQAAPQARTMGGDSQAPAQPQMPQQAPTQARSGFIAPSLNQMDMRAGFAEGGDTQPLAPGQTFQGDGSVKGPGSSDSDSIPARLSNGEFVMAAPAVAFFGVDKLTKLNEQGKQGFMQAQQQVQQNQQQGPGAAMPPQAGPSGPPQMQNPPMPAPQGQPPMGQAKGGSVLRTKGSGFMGM